MVVAAAVLGAAGIASTARRVPPSDGQRRCDPLPRRQGGRVRGRSRARIVETGYFFVRRGPGTSVDYSWGRQPAVGYVPATATILARLTGGKIVAYLAKLRARGVRTVRVLMVGGRVYSATIGCWRQLEPTASPLGTGETYLFNSGGARFLRLGERAGKTAVGFTYAWIPGARAKETSTFGRRPPLAADVSIRVTGAQSLSIRKSITPLAKAPPLPVPPPPHQPAPKPLCVTP